MLPFFAGAHCARSNDEQGAFRAYFELPPGAAFGDDAADLGADFEFYRLPFPADARRREDGSLNVSGHASPGEVLGVDIGEDYLKVVETDADGFGTTTPIFFRFSDIVDTGSICLDTDGVYPEGAHVGRALGMDGGADEDAPDSDGMGFGMGPRGPDLFCKRNAGDERPKATVYLVDVDQDSPDYGEHIPVQITYSRDAGQYICQNWLGLGPLDGRPLRGGTTYAVVITTGVRDIRGAAPILDADFDTWLQAQKQSGDGVVSAQIDLPMERLKVSMRPLVVWARETGVSLDSFAAATVFTTGVPDAIAPKLRDAVHILSEPRFDAGAVQCDVGVISPCDDGLEGTAHRVGCFGAMADFVQIQGEYRNPVYQAGTRPYRQSTDGGNIVLDGEGTPVRQDFERMCYSLALPRDGGAVAPAPAGGWPVVLYAHGTGGSYMSMVADGTARMFTKAGFAVIGIDNVGHGRRQRDLAELRDEVAGGAAFRPENPSQIFFNLANPRASRDNIVQGAADLFYLTRLVREARLSVEGMADIAFDADKVVFFGHSQGTVIAPPYLAAESDLSGAIFSGAGAELALSIMNKRRPVDLREVAQAFFGDRNLSRIHPIIGIVSTLIGSSDMISYAHRFFLDPYPGRTPVPLLLISGVGDSYTPEPTHHALMRGAGIPFVGEVSHPVLGVDTVDGVAKDNVGGITAGAVQIEPIINENLPPVASDGHFVVFQHPGLQQTVVDFAVSAIAGAAKIEN